VISSRAPPPAGSLVKTRRAALLPDEPRVSAAKASATIVSGFVEPIVRELPLEYAVEMNRLIQPQMEGSVG